MSHKTVIGFIFNHNSYLFCNGENAFFKNSKLKTQMFVDRLVFVKPKTQLNESFIILLRFIRFYVRKMCRLAGG